MSESVPLMRPWLGDAEQAAVAEVIASGWVAQGPRVESFERAFADRVGAKHAVAVSSCTAALHLALVLLEVGPGDEVIVPSLSFIATANVVRYVGAVPVFAEVDENTQNITSATLDDALSDRTRAVIAVHQAGSPADMKALHALCDPKSIQLVEDAACAIGSTIDERLIGTHSELVTFSFHPRKVVTTGEGGMLVTAREDFAKRARALREHGMTVSALERHRSDVPVVEQYLETGFNYRMTDLQAAVGLVQIGRLDAMVARRRELATRYVELLGDIDGVRLPRDPEHGTTNFQSFCVGLPVDGATARDRVMACMADRGVATRRGIMAAHLEPAYQDPAVSLPITERIAATTVVLPLFHEMTEAEQDRVVDALRDALVVDRRA